MQEPTPPPRSESEIDEFNWELPPSGDTTQDEVDVEPPVIQWITPDFIRGLISEDAVHQLSDYMNDGSHRVNQEAFTNRAELELLLDNIDPEQARELAQAWDMDALQHRLRISSQYQLFSMFRPYDSPDDIEYEIRATFTGGNIEEEIDFPGAMRRLQAEDDEGDGNPPEMRESGIDFNKPDWLSRLLVLGAIPIAIISLLLITAYLGSELINSGAESSMPRINPVTVQLNSGAELQNPDSFEAQMSASENLQSAVTGSSNLERTVIQKIVAIERNGKVEQLSYDAHRDPGSNAEILIPEFAEQIIQFFTAENTTARAFNDNISFGGDSLRITGGAFSIVHGTNLENYLLDDTTEYSWASQFEKKNYFLISWETDRPISQIYEGLATNQAETEGLTRAILGELQIILEPNQHPEMEEDEIAYLVADEDGIVFRALDGLYYRAIPGEDTVTAITQEDPLYPPAERDFSVLSNVEALSINGSGQYPIGFSATAKSGNGLEINRTYEGSQFLDIVYADKGEPAQFLVRQGIGQTPGSHSVALVGLNQLDNPDQSQRLLHPVDNFNESFSELLADGTEKTLHATIYRESIPEMETDTDEDQPEPTKVYLLTDQDNRVLTSISLPNKEVVEISYNRHGESTHLDISIILENGKIIAINAPLDAEDTARVRGRNGLDQVQGQEIDPGRPRLSSYIHHEPFGSFYVVPLETGDVFPVTAVDADSTYFHTYSPNQLIFKDGQRPNDLQGEFINNTHVIVEKDDEYFLVLYSISRDEDNEYRIESETYPVEFDESWVPANESLQPSTPEQPFTPNPDAILESSGLRYITQSDGSIRARSNTLTAQGEQQSNGEVQLTLDNQFNTQVQYRNADGELQTAQFSALEYSSQVLPAGTQTEPRLFQLRNAENGELVFSTHLEAEMIDILVSPISGSENESANYHQEIAITIEMADGDVKVFWLDSSLNAEEISRDLLFKFQSQRELPNNSGQIGVASLGNGHEALLLERSTSELILRTGNSVNIQELQEESKSNASVLRSVSVLANIDGLLTQVFLEQEEDGNWTERSSVTYPNGMESLTPTPAVENTPGVEETPEAGNPEENSETTPESTEDSIATPAG